MRIRAVISRARSPSGRPLRQRPERPTRRSATVSGSTSSHQLGFAGRGPIGLALRGGGVKNRNRRCRRLRSSVEWIHAATSHSAVKTTRRHLRRCHLLRRRVARCRYAGERADSQRPSVATDSFPDNHDYANLPGTPPSAVWTGRKPDVHIHSPTPAQQVATDHGLALRRCIPYRTGVRQSAAFFRSEDPPRRPRHQPMQNCVREQRLSWISRTSVSPRRGPLVPASRPRLFSQAHPSPGRPTTSVVQLLQTFDLQLPPGLPSGTVATFVDVKVVGGSSEWQFGGGNPHLGGLLRRRRGPEHGRFMFSDSTEQ